MINNITKVTSQLRTVGVDFKISQYELAAILDGNLNLNIAKLADLSYDSEDGCESWLNIQVPASIFIDDFEYMFRKDAILSLEDLIEYIVDLDFTSEIFKLTGVAHRSCDCPKCQAAEDFVYSDFNDEGFEDDMIEYVSNKIAAF